MIEGNRPKVSWQDLFKNEVGRLNEIVLADAVNRRGSFLARNPGLGKMVRCPNCGTRVRQKGLRNGLKCCNAVLTSPEPVLESTPAFLSSDKWTWNDETKEWELIPQEKIAPMLKGKLKRRKPRLSRNRPPLFEMHNLIKQWEGDENLVEARKLQDEIEGLPHFWTPQVQLPIHHLAAFAEKFVTRKHKAEAKRVRDEQKLSRRINWGLA